MLMQTPTLSLLLILLLIVLLQKNTVSDNFTCSSQHIMKKVIFKQYSSSFDDLRMVEDFEKPQIFATDDVLVKVKAVSINPIDWKILSGELKIVTGSSFPKGIAIDFSGVIDKVGSSSSTPEFAVGDEVFGLLNPMKCYGTLAEYIVVKKSMIYKKPKEVSFELAVASLTPVITSIYLFDAVETMTKKKNDSNRHHVLINGASGGVGMTAIQIAKRKTMKVTAVCGTDGTSSIEKYHPDILIDYKKHDIVKDSHKDHPFDIIFELSGSLPFTTAKSIMNTNQSLYVSTFPDPIKIALSMTQNLFSKQKQKYIIASATLDHYQKVCEYITGDTPLDIPIAKIFPFNEYKEAYQLAQKRGIVGRVIITL